MNFRQQIAKYVTGNMTSDQLPGIGRIGLEEELDTPSLRILAGLNKNESPFVIEHYLKLTLDELQITLPDKRQAAIEYALAIADEILSESREIIEGIREIRYSAFGSYDFFSESKQYCYDTVSFEAVYGLFDTFEEVSNAARPWQIDKTNEQLMTEVKLELLVALKKWRDGLNEIHTRFSKAG